MSAYNTFKAGVLGNPYDENKKPSRALTVQGFKELQDVVDADGLQTSLNKSEIATLKENQTSNGLVVATWPELLTITDSEDGRGAEVLDSDQGTHLAASSGGYDGSSVNNAGRYSWNSSWSRWVRVGDTGLTSKVAKTDLYEPIKNLVDQEQIRRGEYYSPGSNKVVGGSTYRCTDYIPVIPGEEYTINGQEGTQNVAAVDIADDDNGSFVNLGQFAETGGTFTIPAGKYFIVANITNNGQDVTNWDDTIQIELGSSVTQYAEYKLGVKKELVPEYEDLTKNSEIFSLVSFNMIDLTKIDYVKRYSTGALTFITDTLGIAASDWIEVEEGQFYAFAGDGVYDGYQGGYFDAYGKVTAISNIVFSSPPTGLGRIFQVPVGQGITHVVVSLRKLAGSASATSLDGDVQLETGELATGHQAYNGVKKVKPSLISDGTDSSSGGSSAFIDSASWYKFVIADEGNSEITKLPNFRDKWLSKNSDVCVVNTGTSLTARSVEHCTAHVDATIRPPLMHSNNFASLIWDRLKWDNQEYRRYDASGYFSEVSGTFTQDTALTEWDDGVYRNGLTRYSETTGASVNFTIPEKAWQFNFIYRTDSAGCDAQISIAGGNSQVEVFDESDDTWKEANNFSFTMNEPTPVTRTVSVPSPSGGSNSDIVISSKANTTYQKRLKMRCKSGVIDTRSTSKSVTITGTNSGRFMYWGVEWSLREHMITYINAARGSHNTQATGTTGLPRYQDNEIWGFKPDLLLFELPIHNDGAAAAGSYAANYWENLTNNFVFRTDYELSLKARGTNFGLSPEIAMFTASIAFNFGGIEDDGKLKLGEQADGQMMTALDKYSQAYLWVKENQPTAVCINAAQRWVDAGNAIFNNNLKDATLGSGKGGSTFTNEGSHWNDTGSKVMAKCVLPLLNFTN